MKENKIYLLKGTENEFSVFLPDHDWAKQPFVLLTSDVNTALSFNYTSGTFNTETIRDLYVLKDNGTLLKCGPTFTEAEPLNLTQIQGNGYSYSNEYETVFGWYKRVIAGELKELYVLGYYGIDSDTNKPKLQPLSERPYYTFRIIVNKDRLFAKMGEVAVNEDKPFSKIGNINIDVTDTAIMGEVIVDENKPFSEMGSITEGATDEAIICKIDVVATDSDTYSNMGEVGVKNVDQLSRVIGNILVGSVDTEKMISEYNTHVNTFNEENELRSEDPTTSE